MIVDHSQIFCMLYPIKFMLLFDTFFNFLNSFLISTEKLSKQIAKLFQNRNPENVLQDLYVIYICKYYINVIPTVKMLKIVSHNFKMLKSRFFLNFSETERERELSLDMHTLYIYTECIRTETVSCVGGRILRE